MKTKNKHKEITNKNEVIVSAAESVSHELKVWESAKYYNPN